MAACWPMHVLVGGAMNSRLRVQDQRRRLRYPDWEPGTMGKPHAARLNIISGGSRSMAARCFNARIKARSSSSA